VLYLLVNIQGMLLTDVDKNRIATMRQRAKLTQAQLAKSLGVTVVTVSRWENSARFPRTKTLAKIASVLGCSIADLFDNSQEVA